MQNDAAFLLHLINHVNKKNVLRILWEIEEIDKTFTWKIYEAFDEQRQKVNWDKTMISIRENEK